MNRRIDKHRLLSSSSAAAAGAATAGVAPRIHQGGLGNVEKCPCVSVCLSPFSPRPRWAFRVFHGLIYNSFLLVLHIFSHSLAKTVFHDLITMGRDPSSSSSLAVVVAASNGGGQQLLLLLLLKMYRENENTRRLSSTPTPHRGKCVCTASFVTLKYYHQEALVFHRVQVGPTFD